MRWDDFRRSENVEDDREESATRGGVPGGAGGLGIGTIIVIGLISWYFGIDPSVLLNGAQILTGNGTQQSAPAPNVSTSKPTDPTGDFVTAVLGDTEDRWKEIFAAEGRTYHPARLRLFRVSEPTACGSAKSAMGPFYCPGDKRVYLDISFFDDLQRRFGACSNASACRFSEAYVVAHEVGHHVQDELGILSRVTASSIMPSARALPTSSRCASSCRPIALPAYGPIMPRPSTTSSIRAMSIKPCKLLQRSATTGCRRRCRATSSPIPLPTELQSSASAGS